MTFKKLISTLTCVLILVLSLSGCGSQNLDYILYIETDEKPATVDPQLANSTTEEMIVRNLFEGLMRLDEKGNLQKGVAKEYEISADGLTYTFKIREDAVWYSGEKITADDFVFAAERAVSPKTRAPKVEFLYSIKNAKEISGGKNLPLGITAVSESELKIELVSPNPNFLNQLTSAVFMPCNRKAFLTFKGKYGMNAEDILTNGSFYLKNFVKEGDYSLKIQKSKNYEGEFKAEASAVIFSVGEKEYRAEKINKNNVDMGFMNFSGSLENVNVSEFSKTCYALVINSASNFGRDEFKKAIRMAIDKTAMGGELDESLKPAENLLPQVIAKDGEELSSALKVNSTASYNPSEARKNYLSGADKYGDPGNITILYSGGEAQKSVALFVAESLQKTLGVVANIQNEASVTELNDKVSLGEYNLAIMPITANSSSVLQYLSKFTSENGSNIYGFSSEEYNALFEGINDYSSKEKTITTSQKMLNEIEKSLIITPLFYEREAFGFGKIYTLPTISPFSGVIDLALVKKVA